MFESTIYDTLRDRDIAIADMLISETTTHRWAESESPEQITVFSGQNARPLAMDETALERLLTGRSITAKNFARRRLKLLADRCSKDIKEGRVRLETANKLAAFIVKILPLIENTSIVIPTADEMGILFNWYIDWQARDSQEPAVVISTVCPDYPYDWVGSKAMFKSGLVGNDIGLIGESLMASAPHLLYTLVKCLDMSFLWIVGYAGFEAKPGNLETMKISAAEFRGHLEISALKLQEKIGVPVGILPDMIGVTIEQFAEIRESYKKEDFDVQRKGMDALASAVDARDWAGVFHIAKRLNAIIIDGASVYMGRKAYRKAEQILSGANHTPRFYCVCNYMGFDR